MKPLRIPVSDGDARRWRRSPAKRSLAPLPAVSVRPCASALLVTAALLAACSSPRPEAATADEVETSNMAYFDVAPTAKATDHDEERATGTLFAPVRSNGVRSTTSDGTTLRYSCGVTFVSPRYAVTAGHCVDNESVVDPARDLVTIQMYRFPTEYNWLNARTLSGPYPHITHPSIPGYEADIVWFSCRVVSRCYRGSKGDQNMNCPLTASIIDVALVRCDADVASRGFTWLDVAADDDMSAPPYMPWTHEVYEAPALSTPLGVDVQAHYTWHTSPADNFHYWDTRADGTEVNQVVQLVSIAPPGQSLHKVGLDESGAGVETDLGGCHGTSGSGVLQWNTAKSAYELLGPVVLGPGPAWHDETGHDLLCQAARSKLPGQAALTYGPLAQTRALAALATDCAWPGDAFPGNTCSCGPRIGPCPAEAPACVNGQCSCALKVDPCGAYQNCGFADDGCGGQVSCGECSSGYACNAGVCGRGTSCCPAHCPTGKICDPSICACVLPQ